MTRELSYKETLCLPKTSFPIKPHASQEQERARILWQKEEIYEKMSALSQAKECFILHDGPPFANGHLHMGHALNKVLKDIILRSQYMMGKTLNYTPGWDCHGLPIEWKIEERYREKGLEKDSIPLNTFRKECRAFAQEWVTIQSQEFQEFGVVGAWNDPYTTMSYQAEARIVQEFLSLVEKGYVYQGLRPIMWSIVEKTALAEAEIEYKERLSPTVFVRFPVKTMPNTSVVIWTTTPWTLPANRMLAFSPNLTYSLYETASGEKLILADSLVENVCKATNLQGLTLKETIDDLSTLVCRHPLWRMGYDRSINLWPAAFVTSETGTGLVHIAPEHGPDDYALALEHKIDIPVTIGPDGVYLDHVPGFAGLSILHSDGSDGEANKAVIKALEEADALVAQGKLRHSYPHSWRSKAPLIYRTTPQFFIDLKTVRPSALKALEQVSFTPETGRNRLTSMVEKRPDWVISRQRLWGVPLGIFIHKETGEILKNTSVNQRIIKSFLENGSDIWFEKPVHFFLDADVENPEDYEKILDVLDVWFDSGCTQAFFLQENKLFPADLYLEGSDQHRGWFQSSLLCACAAQNQKINEAQAPYKRLLTHGFVVDEAGKKMSKSLGNTLSPEKVIQQYGVDVLRIWIASCDFEEDLRIGPTILASCAETHRKIRNTFRYILGNLHDYHADNALHESSSMPLLERWVQHKLASLDELVRAAYQNFDFKKVFHTLFQFINNDLSSFYFDIRKDCLYCELPTSLKRRACQTVLYHTLEFLLAWLAPILPFTTEEVWQHAPFLNKRSHSVHTKAAPSPPVAWLNPELDEEWERIRHLRRSVLVALEQDRKNNVIGSSLESCPRIFVQDEKTYDLLEKIDFAEILITSQVVLEKGLPSGREGPVWVENKKALGLKCARCWRILPSVVENGDYPFLCERDKDIVRALTT